MANPLFSFVHPIDNKRYFFIWDTFTGLPKTLPMNLLNLLQFYGLYNLPEIEVIFALYPDLVKHGTTIPGDTFDKTNKNIKELLNKHVIFTKVNDEYEAVSQKMEKLFSDRQDFECFWNVYEKEIENINIYPPYPFQYYHFLAFTGRCLFYTSREELKLHQVIEECTKGKNPENVNFYEVNNWFTRGYMKDFEETMVKLFYELAKINLIDVSAIPHSLRYDSRIETLFLSYEFGGILPRKNINYDINKRYTASFKTIELTDNIIVQILNNHFHKYSLNLYTEEIGNFDNGLTSAEVDLRPLLNEFYDAYSEFVNFFDENNNALYPYGLVLPSEKKIENFYILSEGAFDVSCIYDRDGIIINMPAEEIIFMEPDVFALSKDNKSNILKFDKNLRFYKELEHRISPFYNKFHYYPELNAFFLGSGWISISGEILTPMCFTNCGDLRDDMIAFEMNGRWGYMDRNFKIVIPPIFAVAHGFRDGKASVYLWERDYRDQSGEWIKLPSWIPIIESVKYELNEALFREKFPNFPEFYWYNIQRTYDPFKQDDEVIPKNAVFTIIDKNGKIFQIEAIIMEKENLVEEELPFYLRNSIGNFISVDELTKEYFFLLEKYDYTDYHPDNGFIDMEWSDEEKETLFTKLIEESRGSSIIFYNLPIHAKKDVDFVIRLLESGILSSVSTASYFLYNKRFLEAAIKTKNIYFSDLPWAFKDCIDELRDLPLDNDLPF